MRLNGQSCVLHKELLAQRKRMRVPWPMGERPGLKRVAEKVPREIKNVPQRLKPHCKQSAFGTAEAVPLSKTDFFSTHERPETPEIRYRADDATN